MLTEERKRRILELLQAQGRVVATALSAEFRVSEDTIRRDLRELAGEGLLKRVHGGALPLARAAVLDFAARREEASNEKRALAAAAVGRVASGQVILIDGGSTNLLLAELLPLELRGTVITPSPAVALSLSRCGGVEVVLTGGKLVHRAGTTAGPATVEMLRGVRADLCFLGVCSVDVEVGASCSELDELHVKRAMIESAAEVIALATADKLDAVAPYVVAPIAALTCLVTSSRAPETKTARYARAGLEVVRVPMKG